jgi:hypothetical protein
MLVSWRRSTLTIFWQGVSTINKISDRKDSEDVNPKLKLTTLINQTNQLEVKNKVRAIKLHHQSFTAGRMDYRVESDNDNNILLFIILHLFSV